LFDRNLSSEFGDNAHSCFGVNPLILNPPILNSSYFRFGHSTQAGYSGCTRV